MRRTRRTRRTFSPHTGARKHRYVNPERSMPEDALAVHGITAEFLASQPCFGAVVDELLAFIGSDRLVIHNAEFDLAFLNAELVRLERASSAKSIGLIISGGKPPSRVALAMIDRAKGNAILGVSIRISGASISAGVSLTVTTVP